MSRRRHQGIEELARKYPPSPPCSCDVCVGYCARPGWWTVREAARAIRAGYAGRMMLEVAPELNFGVLSPAFKGSEMVFALNENAYRGCTFLTNERCELYGTGCQPLECRYCHHERAAMGLQCHADIEKGWATRAGRALVLEWCDLTGFRKRQDIYGLDWLKPKRISAKR